MFNLKPFLDTANELVRLDEVERALWLLDNLPGYYRDNQPREVINLKSEIMARVCTPTTYASMDIDYPKYTVLDKAMADTLRAKLIVAEVRFLNKNGLTPHIIDLGPGDYWVEPTLKQNGLEFTYEPRTLKPLSTKPIVDSTQPVIFIALEIIEHLWNERDLKIEALKLGKLPDVVHISTPKYAFDPGCPDWRVREHLGHLRTYTPFEFRALIDKLFNEYAQVFYDSTVMECRLILRESRFSCLTDSWSVDILEGL